MKKKKSLWNIFLIPILIIVFVQGAVPFLTLIFSGIRSNMENAVIGLDSHTVENRKVVLENDMIEQWSSVYKESDSLSSALTKVLSNHQMDMQGFMGSGKVQEEYLETVFYDMVEVCSTIPLLEFFWFWEMTVIQIRKGNTKASG